MSRLETVDRKNWREFMAAPKAVLMLANSWCPKCAAWSAELEAFLAQDERFRDVRFGRIYLNRWRLRDFERSNPWIEAIDDLPHNVLLVNGEVRKSWPGGGIQRLLDRLEGEGAGPAAAAPEVPSPQI